MDNARSIGTEDVAADHRQAGEPRMDPPPAIGADERRMHVRAYKFWVSLLRGGSFPPRSAIDPRILPDFGPHGVLLDFRNGAIDPAIAYLGDALRRESGVTGEIARISDVPGRSLLSRLTDHYLEIIANRAPIGFEAEFVNTRGNYTLYRGILLPFSSTGETIDFVYGVINWKEQTDAATSASLATAIGGALASLPRQQAAPSQIWADGPGTPLAAGGAALAADMQPPPPDDPLAEPPAEEDDAGLADCLAAARSSAEALGSVDVRSRSALYRALGIAYDFSCAAARHPEVYREMLADAGIRAPRRAPMTAIVKLVFGADYDKARRTEFATVLAHGHRIGLGSGAMRRLLDGGAGGLKALVAAERRARGRPAPAAGTEATQASLRTARPLGRLRIDAGGDEFVLLLARREPGRGVAVVASVPADPALVTRALRRLQR